MRVSSAVFARSPVLAAQEHPLLGQRHKGSSLLEVLVALFVLAVGILGVLSMQAKSGKYTQSTYYYSQAVFLANDIADAMRTNRSVAASYTVLMTDPLPNAKNCASTTENCTASELRDWNVRTWLTNIAASLPQGKASIESDGDFFTITVQFNDSRASGNDDESLHEYVLVTEV
jgi:type IV pilus assembly protein PilV